MLNHEQDHGRFPEGANTAPYHNNGLLLLLPYIEQTGLSDQFDMKVHQRNAPNSYIVKHQIATFQCPSDDSAGRTLLVTAAVTHEVSRGNYVFCYGPQYFYPPSGSPDNIRAKKEQLETGGPFMYKFGRRIREFIDGTSHTIMASELRTGKDDNQSFSGGNAGNRGGDHRGAWSWAWGGENVSTP